MDHLPAGTGDEGGANLPAGAKMLADDTGRRCFLGAAPAPGSETFIGVLTARKLRAGRVLVLVPTLDLLTQMAAAWPAGGPYRALVRDLLTGGR